MNRVDIVVPCYNYGRYLRTCVRSLLMQEGVEVRVLILDDCSPDNTEEVGRQLASEDPRVEFRRHAANRGHISTYNEGLLEWASRDYCLLLSADDMLTPGALRRATKLMDEHEEVGLTYGRVINSPHPERELFEEVGDYSTQVMSGIEFLECMCAAGENVVPTPSAVLRTSLQQKIGGYLPELPHAGDMEMWLTCGFHAAIGIIQVDQACYRVHGNNMSFDYDGTPDLRQRKSAFDMVFARYAYLIPDPAALQRKAKRSLAEQSLCIASKLFDRDERSRYPEYLDLALEFDPDVRHTPQWLKLRAKRAIGYNSWAMIRPIVRGLRRRPLSGQNQVHL